MSTLRYLLTKILSAFTDVLPILTVILVFQILVIKKPFPHLEQSLAGMVLVVLGLFLFIAGLESALFPFGERLANQFALKGKAGWIVLFGFALGFATTIAEPALTVIANKAGQLAAESGVIENHKEAILFYVYGLRITIALAVGFAIALGVLRIIKGWPLVWFILAGYSLIVAATLFAPREIIGIAYDSGGITTSTITVPLVTVLGLGLAASIRGRHPLIDGFGLIALASLTPILAVMIFGMTFYGVSG